MVRAVRRTKENTASGPANIGGRVWRCCAEQLGGVFQLLFQQSMDGSTVPQIWLMADGRYLAAVAKKFPHLQDNEGILILILIWKHSIVVPIPKKSWSKL